MIYIKRLFLFLFPSFAYREMLGRLFMVKRRSTTDTLTQSVERVTGNVKLAGQSGAQCRSCDPKVSLGMRPR